MKIAIIKNLIPIPCANVINTLKHAHTFFNLSHKVEILAVEQFLEERWRLKLKDIHNFYGINQEIRLYFFRGGIFFYFRKYKFFMALLRFLKLFPKIFNFFDPEVKISKYCLKNNIDLSYCRGTYRTAYRNIVNNIPTILESHHYNISPELRNVIKLSENKNFIGIITISDILKHNFIRYGVPEEKILVLEDAVELEKFDKITDNKTVIRKILNLPLQKRIILYSGGLYDFSGINIILEAADILNNKEISFYFLGGTKKQIKKWKKYKKKNNIKANIHFLGFKPNIIIPFYLKAANILLSTYSPNCQTLKWMSPIKIFEYMGSKTPFIATRIRRKTEICNNNDCVFTNPEDPRDLSNKINILINDKDLQNKIVENSYQKAKNHTYKKRCKRIIEFSKYQN